MTDVSAARQKLRDLAREEITMFTPGSANALPTAKLTKLGELAGPLFMAVQAALTVAEELRDETQLASMIAREAAADRLEAAVLKALT